MSNSRGTTRVTFQPCGTYNCRRRSTCGKKGWSTLRGSASRIIDVQLLRTAQHTSTRTRRRQYLGRARSDIAWRRQEFKEPGLLIKTCTRSLKAMVDGDVDTSFTPEVKRRKTGAYQVLDSKCESGCGSSESPLRRGKIERRHNVVNGHTRPIVVTQLA